MYVPSRVILITTFHYILDVCHCSVTLVRYRYDEVCVITVYKYIKYCREREGATIDHPRSPVITLSQYQTLCAILEIPWRGGRIPHNDIFNTSAFIQKLYSDLHFESYRTVLKRAESVVEQLWKRLWIIFHQCINFQKVYLFFLHDTEWHFPNFDSHWQQHNVSWRDNVTPQCDMTWPILSGKWLACMLTALS